MPSFRTCLSSRPLLFRPPHLALVYIFLLLPFLSAAKAEQTCYYPDGHTAASADRPCNAGPGPSACCGKQADGSPSHCLSNGLCLTDLKISRGSCTDATWNSSECASVCTRANVYEGNVISSCGYGNQLWTCDKCSESNFTMSPSILIAPAERAAIVANATGNGQSANSTCPTLAPSGSSNQPTIMIGIIGGTLGFALLVNLIVVTWQVRRNIRLKDRLKQQSKRLEGSWDRGGGNGPVGPGGAPRGFGWGAGSDGGHGHPWSPYLPPAHQPPPQMRVHPPDEHQTSPPWPGGAGDLHRTYTNGHGPSPVTPLDATTTHYWWAPDIKNTACFHEMDGDRPSALEKELTLPRQEKECTPPRRPPFERKWFTLRGSST